MIRVVSGLQPQDVVSLVPFAQSAELTAEDATQAERRGDSASVHAASARALRAALGLRIPGAAALATEEILGHCGEDEAARAGALMLARLDRARFEPDAAAPDFDAARACIEVLRRPRP